ncbi:MAG TPA: response regulator [Ignavibacteriales bacterium]|nr:response regulator [Ignavibacteriales bacterium]
MNILIAGDNSDSSANMERILLKKDAAVYKAKGNEVIALMRSTPFDAVLLDIKMTGLDGMEIVKQIRKDDNFSEVYIAALADDPESDDIEIYLQSGFNEVLARPVDDYILYKFIDRVVEAKSRLQT